MIIGLTGGIGSGKSTVSNILREMGYEIVDADRVAYNITNKKENLDKIANLFGDEFIKSGKLDRKALANKVFQDKNELKKLNDLLHPQVIAYFKEKKLNAQKNEIIIFDVPLLFEVGIDKFCDEIIVISIDENIQIERIIKRDNCTKDLAKKIIDNQMSLAKKLEKASVIIENNGTHEELINQTKEKLTKLVKNDNII